MRVPGRGTRVSGRVASAKMALFDLIEDWHNPHRRRSALGCLGPTDFERAAHRPPSRTIPEQPPYPRNQKESTLAHRLSTVTATPAKVTTCLRDRGKSR